MSTVIKLKAEKIKLLSEADLLERGWENKDISGKKYYQKGNYVLILYSNSIRIFFRDPVQCNWMDDPENFRMMCKLPVPEVFDKIMQLI